MMMREEDREKTGPLLSSALVQQLAALRRQISTVIKGKPAQIADCVACLVAGGHLLIEDLPGVGKTTLAHTLSVCLGLRFSRVQFTSDLMPSDLLGVSVYVSPQAAAVRRQPPEGEREAWGGPALPDERQQGSFAFHPGPVFAQVLLADEINRAGPKTQSALLEAMEEQQVSIDGQTHALPKPFFVIATQNPSEQLGTYPLPESQLDRFLMRISLGYPDERAERELLMGQDSREIIRALRPVMSPADLLAAQAAVRQVHAAPALLDYLQALLAATRSGQWFVEGLSPRAGLAVLRAARARALMDERDYVSPEDVQRILPQTIAHRLRPKSGSGRGAREQVRAMIEALPLP